MIGGGRVDVVTQRLKPAAQPVDQLGPLLLGKFHHAGVLVQRGAQLFHLAVPLILHGVVHKDQRAVLRKILQQRDQGIALPLIQLENVHVLHRHQSVLGHHGHRLHRFGQRLHRQTLSVEMVVVELLKPGGDQQLTHLLEITGAEIRLLTVKNIHVLQLLFLQVSFQTGKAFILRHILLLREW